MKHLPFDKPGTFFRGNLHTHSTMSDGTLTPEEVCTRYREAGYDFLALTDHFKKVFNYPLTDTRPYQKDDFITLLGAELHVGKIETGHEWHIVASGLPLDFAPPSNGETGPEIAARAMDAGAYVVVAHPHWNNLTENDVMSLGDIHAIETWNGACAYMDVADGWYMLDLLLARGKYYFGNAGDDAHFRPNDNGFATGWVWVKSETLSETAILQALKAGHYYSSSGPEIYDIQVYPGDKVIVRCSPADGIILLGENPSHVRVLGIDLIKAELPLEKIESPYARVIVKDRYGKRAWSNPFFINVD